MRRPALPPERGQFACFFCRQKWPWAPEWCRRARHFGGGQWLCEMQHGLPLRVNNDAEDDGA